MKTNTLLALSCALAACQPIEPESLSPTARAAQPLDGAAIDEALARFAPRGELTESRRWTDELGLTHVVFTQKKDGLEVVGGEVYVHLDQAGALYDAHGVTAREPMPLHDSAHRPAGAQLVWVIRSADQHAVLAWEHFDENADFVYVDALTGAVADRHPTIHTALARKIYTSNNGTGLPGTLLINEGGTSGDSTATDAYGYTGKVYDFYKTIFLRDSFDNAGGTLTSSVHYGSRYDNAFWNGTQMVFGDGDGTTFASFAKSLDVTAHELTHAVTGSTAKLVYQNESGALNEAMSDILGVTCETWTLGANFTPTVKTYLMAEDIYTPAKAGDALRYLDDPKKDGSSYDYYPTRYLGSSDNGGVHSNSGIGNLAFALMIKGGTHPRAATNVNVPPLGLEKSARIFYRALTTYMTSTTNFLGARTATVKAANDLYPGDSRAVEAAWAAVGVGTPPPPACVPNDGFCDLGCTPFDVDCYCIKDQKCDPMCADLSKDPDCPKDCVQNSVCAIEDCPRPDPDCVEVGQACTDATQCKERKCTGDPEHPATYCSKPCSAELSCPAGMECSERGACQFPQTPPTAAGEACTPGATRCAKDTVCAEGRCLAACVDDYDCAVGSRCSTTEDGLRYCRELSKRPASQSALSADDELIGGCSASSGTAALWLAGLTAFLLRRRRPELERRGSGCCRRS
jgi:MYXO-CTERM domain-containing protein